MFCKVSRLLLLTKRFKAFLSLFVKLFFLPLRVKVSTVPVLRYLLTTLVIALLVMFNSLDSSALFCPDSDRVKLNSLVSVDSSAPFDPWELKINSQKQNKTKMTTFCDLTLNLMLNDWYKRGVKAQTALIPLLSGAMNFFFYSWSDVWLLLFLPIFSSFIDKPRALHWVFQLTLCTTRVKNFGVFYVPSNQSTFPCMLVTFNTVAVVVHFYPKF